MRSPLRWLGFGITALLLVLTVWAADQPSKPPTGPKSPPVTPADSGKSPSRGLDASKLPEGAIMVISKDAADGLQQVPDAVVLKPEVFKKLWEQLEKPVSPGACKLSATAGSDVVHVRAEFEFSTDKPRARIALGCQKAWPTAAKLDEDGRLPLLFSAPEDEGFVVQVDTPGKHKLILDMDVPVISPPTRGTERGFELGLPHAAITTLERFDLPDQVSELRIPGRPPILSKSLSSKNAGRKPVALGPLDRLKISWKGPAPQQQADPLLTALGQVKVEIDDAQITLVADLTFQSLRGPAGQWRLQLPSHTRPQDVRVEAKDERTGAVTPPADPAKLPVWTIQLSEPSSDPFHVIVRVSQPRPKVAPGTAPPPAAIGPFTLLNAFHQKGSISINAPPDVRLQFRPHGDISQGEVPEDQRREGPSNPVASFYYWSLPPPANPSQLAAAPLEILIEPVKGAIEGRLEHTFSLRPDRTWQVSTKIEVTPVRTGIDALVLLVPPGYRYDREVGPSPAGLVEDVVVPEGSDNQAREAHIRLAQQRQYQPFSITLVGVYGRAVEEGQHVALPLPQLRGTLDRGGKVRAIVPQGMEVSLQNAEFRNEQAEPWGSERAPARVDLAWRRYRPEMPVHIDVDITLLERQARVEEQLRFSFLGGPAKQVTLRAADFPTGRLPEVDGGTIAAAADAWTVTLKEPANKEHLLKLSYSINLPPPGEDAQRQRLIIPIAWPEEATSCRTKVRVFGDPSVQPVPVGEGPWERQPTESVQGRSTLPRLVLLGQGLDLPLMLRLSPASATLLPAVVVDRLLLQVAIAEGGYQSYRARFHLSKPSSRTLDVELPAPARSLNYSVQINHKQSPKARIVDEDGKESETGRIVRLFDLGPVMNEKGGVLEIHYQIPAGRLEGNGKWQSTLYPPRLLGDAFLGRVRWQIAVPSGWMPLYLEDGFSPELRWGWRGWLLGPNPAVSDADLERWFTADLPPFADGEAVSGSSSSALDSGDGLVGWQSSATILRVFQVPQRAWLLACSLAFLLLGLGLYFARLSRGFYWFVVVVLGVAAALAGIWWPSVLPAVVYACEPGALVLAAVLGIQWMLQRRYRRQVVFMPGFSRLKPGSSVTRPGSSSRPRGEPSTVDEPPGSGQRVLGGAGQKEESNAP